MEKIDLEYDFRNDTPLNKDIDIHSKKLRIFQSKLWNKKLPNGEILNLEIAARKTDYLKWKNFRFSSDSIIVSFAYNNELIEKVKKETEYDKYRELYLQKSCTLAGEIIFPKHKNSINQQRGMNKFIIDRFDITLDCIRKYYLNLDSPLYKYLINDKDFFDLFIDFKGFVDFFYLNDLVSDDYKSIRFFIPYKEYVLSPFPKDYNEYDLFIKNELDFLEKRKNRIAKALKIEIR